MDRNWNLGKLLVDIERCFYHIKQIKIEHIWHFGIVQTTRFFFTKKNLRKVTIATISPWQQCCLYSKKYTQFWGFMRAFQLALCQFLYFNHFHIFLSFKKHTQFHIETKKLYCCASPFLANCWCSRIWEIHVLFYLIIIDSWNVYLFTPPFFLPQFRICKMKAQSQVLF